MRAHPNDAILFEQTMALFLPPDRGSSTIYRWHSLINELRYQWIDVWCGYGNPGWMTTDMLNSAVYIDRSFFYLSRPVMCVPVQLHCLSQPLLSLHSRLKTTSWAMVTVPGDETTRNCFCLNYSNGRAHSIFLRLIYRGYWS